MASLKDLATNMEKLNSAVQHRSSAISIPRDSLGRFIVRQSTITFNVAWLMVEFLIDSTPVDTGKAVSNWQIKHGTANPTEIEPYFPGERGATAEACRAAAKRVAKKDLKIWDKQSNLHIVNYVYYIEIYNLGKESLYYWWQSYSCRDFRNQCNKNENTGLYA